MIGIELKLKKRRLFSSIYITKNSTTLIFLVFPIYLYSLFLSFVLSVFLFVLSIRGSYLFFYKIKKKKKKREKMEEEEEEKKAMGGGGFFKPLDSL